MFKSLTAVVFPPPDTDATEIIHLLYYITEKRSQDIYTIEDIIPIYNVEMKIFTGNKKVKTIKVPPQRQEIPFKAIDDYTVFNVDKVQGHSMISVEY
ncbi:hypothetical protein [Clostridium polynesiense]|uniref:hypothetical protein n=1 Tax=Clostridium polynesiense TaxID=1325933 RepID=UPI00058E4030|nr:hypothetical protein [Clostridium polynesiense]